MKNLTNKLVKKLIKKNQRYLSPNLVLVECYLAQLHQ